MKVRTIYRRAPEGPNSLASYERSSRRLAGTLGSAFDVNPEAFPQITFNDDSPLTYGPAAPIPTQSQEVHRDWSAAQDAVQQVGAATLDVLGMTYRQQQARREAQAAADMAASHERRAAMEIEAAREERAFAERYGTPAAALGLPLLLGAAGLVIFLVTKK